MDTVIVTLVAIRQIFYYPGQDEVQAVAMTQADVNQLESMRRQIRIDPRNTEFEWRSCAGPHRILSEAQAQQYDDKGYFLLEQAFSVAEMEAVIAAIDPIEREYSAMLKERYGGRLLIARADEITFSIHLVLKSQFLNTFSRHRVFQDLCHDTMAGASRLYWDQAVYKKSGTKEEFPWHQDNGYTFTQPQQYLTCWVALTDATIDNGCPWVLPGLHKLGTLIHEDTRLGRQCISQSVGAVAVPARAGDVVVFSSLTPHRTGPNLTDAIRKSYILQYAPDGAVTLTGEENVRVLQNHPQRQYLVHAG